jgi:hypothetical protein
VRSVRPQRFVHAPGPPVDWRNRPLTSRDSPQEGQGIDGCRLRLEVREKELRQRDEALDNGGLALEAAVDGSPDQLRVTDLDSPRPDDGGRVQKHVDANLPPATVHDWTAAADAGINVDCCAAHDELRLVSSHMTLSERPRSLVQTPKLSPRHTASGAPTSAQAAGPERKEDAEQGDGAFFLTLHPGYVPDTSPIHPRYKVEVHGDGHDGGDIGDDREEENRTEEGASAEGAAAAAAADVLGKWGGGEGVDDEAKSRNVDIRDTEPETCPGTPIIHVR